MKLSILVAAGLLCTIADSDGMAQSNYAFSYQGYLTVSDSPADGSYDLQFDLYDGPDPGTATFYGQDVHTSIDVSDGLYDVILDFGDIFSPPEPKWLLVSVRESGVGTYEALQPLSFLSTVPYASYAWIANNALSAVNAEYASVTGQSLSCRTVQALGADGQAIAHCTDPEVVTGGGCHADPVSIEYNRPLSDQSGWECSIGAGDVGVFAICCKLE